MDSVKDDSAPLESGGSGGCVAEMEGMGAGEAAAVAETVRLLCRAVREDPVMGRGGARKDVFGLRDARMADGIGGTGGAFAVRVDNALAVATAGEGRTVCAGLEGVCKADQPAETLRADLRLRSVGVA